MVNSIFTYLVFIVSIEKLFISMCVVVAPLKRRARKIKYLLLGLVLKLDVILIEVFQFQHDTVQILIGTFVSIKFNVEQFLYSNST